MYLEKAITIWALDPPSAESLPPGMIAFVPVTANVGLTTEQVHVGWNYSFGGPFTAK